MAKVLEQSAPQAGGGMKLSGFGTAMIWLAMLFGSISVAIVEGAPILGPDLESCRPVIPPTKTKDEAVDCCFLDTGKPIKDFEFNLDLPVRVRRPAHKLDEEFVRKYERAVELMRALPAHDPRSFAAQSKLHCTYCAAAYSQFNSSETLDIHHCWLVLPWHRWYLYFHERILASLIGDDTFAIPYWAWDVQNESSPPANSMPSIYTNASSPLFDPFRSKLHQPPSRVDLSFYGRDTVDDGDPEEQKQVNFNVLWGAMVADVKTPEAFYGGKFSQGFPVEFKDGVFEIGPHASIHAWTGDENEPLKEDMAPAYSAARDPIFFAHHSNVDRLWLMWKSFGRPDFDDQDWLDAEFLFYDENAEMVRVNIRNSLDADKLRISYEQVPADWLEYTPKSIRDTDPTYIHTGIVRQFWHQVLGWDVVRNTAMALGKLFVREEREPERVLDGIVGRAVVTSRASLRPKINFQGNVSSVYDEVIAVSGAVEKPYNVGVVLHMFLELPEANANTPRSCVEFLGSVIVDPEGLYDGEETTVVRKFTRTIGIGHRLRILGASRQESLTVTFVPAWDPQYDAYVSVRITDLSIEMKLIP